jgi:hypothetical protein
MRPLLLALLAVLVLPAAALGGGYATAGLSSTPAGVAPGEPWAVDITILQHGRTPMTDVEPAVVVTGPDGTEQRFAGEKTAEPGVYRAVVTFPEAGRFSYTVDDGFTNAIPHEFPPVTISGAAAAGGAGDGLPWWPLLALLPLLAGAAVLALRRGQLRKEPAGADDGPATAPDSVSAAISSGV